MIKVIWDDGTPACLPRWARDEMVSLRLKSADLKSRCAELAQELAQATGDAEPFLAAMRELHR